MLDKKTDAVLELLTQKAKNSYKVLNKEDLLNELPKKLDIDMQDLQGIITFLKENEYVDVKYQDKEEICISSLSWYFTQKAKITNGQVGLLILGVFLAAFFGAFIASLIGKLL